VPKITNQKEFHLKEKPTADAIYSWNIEEPPTATKTHKLTQFAAQAQHEAKLAAVVSQPLPDDNDDVFD